jgi:hypothetical protein
MPTNYQKPQEDPRKIGGGLKELGYHKRREKLQTISTSRPDIGILMVSTKTLGRAVFPSVGKLSAAPLTEGGRPVLSFEHGEAISP